MLLGLKASYFKQFIHVSIFPPPPHPIAHPFHPTTSHPTPPSIPPIPLLHWPEISAHLKNHLKMPEIQQATLLKFSHVNVNKLQFYGV